MLSVNSFACKPPAFLSQTEIVSEKGNHPSPEMLFRAVSLQLLAMIKGLFSALSQKIVRDVALSDMG